MIPAAIQRAFSVRPVAALFVAAGGSYSDLPGVDLWDAQRDARLYSGPHPVVAHPPCQRWGKFWAGSPRVVAATGLRKVKGDDGGCFLAALRAVRAWGGVIEHPWGSAALAAYGLKTPPRGGGWIALDSAGGYACCVEQGRYGHYARKPTILIAYHCQLPELDWGESAASYRPELVERLGLARVQRLGELALRGGRVDSSERIGTPEAFRDLLLSIARSAAPPAVKGDVRPPGPWKGAYWERKAAETRARVARIGQRQRPAEPAAARPVRSLEEVTLDDRSPVWEGKPCEPRRLGVRVVAYSDGARVVLYRCPSRSGTTKRADSESGLSVEAAGTAERSASAESLEVDQARLSASLSRSRRLVVHRARCLGARALWTFTKRGKFASVDEVWSAWAIFRRLMTKRYGQDFRYVAVPELHADGETWHLHVLVDRLYMVESFRVLWNRALGGTGAERGQETRGNVDVKGPRFGRAVTARRFAYYCAKYVGKGFEGCAGGRRLFSCSAGLNPVVDQTWRAADDFGLAEFADAVSGWLSESIGVRGFYPRLLYRDTYELGIAEVPLDAAALGRLQALVKCPQSEVMQ